MDIFQEFIKVNAVQMLINLPGQGIDLKVNFLFWIEGIGIAELPPVIVQVLKPFPDLGFDMVQAMDHPAVLIEIGNKIKKKPVQQFDAWRCLSLLGTCRAHNLIKFLSGSILSFRFAGS
jgi:hypothetical protein